jgi:phosphate transport system substrate-binding protein
MKMFKNSLMAVVFTVASATGLQALSVDPNLPKYVPVSGVSGNLSSVGSDTLNNLMAEWAEGFRRIYPNVRISVEGKGSSTAPAALIAGTAQLGPMSREVKSSENENFEKIHGYKMTSIAVALDALSVFVNKDNPVDALSLDQIDGIFSSTRRSGSANITDWSQVGGEKGIIRLFGRNSASGTYGFFKEVALFNGDYKSAVKEQPGSASVVQAIGRDKQAMGYSGMGYLTSRTKALKLAKKGSKDYYAASPENVVSGKYPLWRFLIVAVNKAPNKPMDKVTYEFLKYVLSQEGQEVTIKDGFIPVSADQAKKMMELMQ